MNDVHCFTVNKCVIHVSLWGILLPLILLSDFVSINRLSLILKMIGQCEIHYNTTD